uniref:Uncharacterized protein n=1 Tax=Anguilla anguilla TaxID=7936 RepID=A0A0E9PCN0_ANGAN
MCPFYCTILFCTLSDLSADISTCVLLAFYEKAY